jgi:hypothetical protein
MVWIHKPHLVIATDAGEPGNGAGGSGTVTERHDLLPVAAAWPAGVSQLAQAIVACQRDATALPRAGRVG